MIQDTMLTIRLPRGHLRPRPGEVFVNELRGGPETLLRWLETQLGLPIQNIHSASRITEYAAALDTVDASVIAASMKTDRWATAAELLSRRDALLLAAWDETESDLLPPLVRDLAKAAAGRTFVFPGEAERLQQVLDALEGGQVLPPHRCALHDPPDAWPAKWRRVLSKLHIVPAVTIAPHAPAGSALRRAQAVLAGDTGTAIEQDATFRYMHTRSQSAAVEFVTAALVGAPDKLSTTVICCENDHLALRLDACLSRLGFATTGASAWSRAHPVLQVLPLTLALCWEPVDPQSLLDFLTLPVLPIPRRAASRLATALTAQPGLGSSAWEATLQELCSQESDPDGRLKERLDAWLCCERARRGGDISSHLVRERCGMIAQWATGRASMLAQEDAERLELIEALHVAAGQASLLGQLAESQGATLSEPQLLRLFDESLANGLQAKPFLEADGGPMRVRSLAEVDAPFDRLIWLGLGAEDVAGCRWSTNQLLQLRSAGIELDDGSKALSALRAAEVRGFCHARDSFIAVLLPQDLEQRWHPVWLAIRGLLPERDMENPPVMEDLIARGDVSSLTPFTCPTTEQVTEPPQKLRPLWHIPAGLLRDRETVSATELQDRLACPLKWTLNHQARLRSSPIAKLPDDHQLTGTFCHGILERVFGGGGDLPSLDDAVARVLVAFDERLPLDAAPLAQPHKYLDCQRVRGQMENATRVLVSTLASGGYRIVGIEVEISAEAFEKRLNGWIDCVAARENGDEALIDFKYSGRTKYYKLIEEGKAVQLATYAYGRSKGSSRFPAIAYLVISDGILYTPSAGPIEGDSNRSVIDGPAIQAVWQAFSDALTVASDWLTSGSPIPARPLQDASNWPAGTTILLDTNLKAHQVQDVCKYCDYKRICGIQETL